MSDILIIDTHTHAEPWFTSLPEAPAAGTFDNLFANCRHRTRLVVSTTGHDLLKKRSNVGEARKLAELLRPFGDKFIGSVMVNPHDTDDAVAAVEIGVKELGMKAVGELVQYIHDWRTDGPEILPVVMKAIELDVPMDFHSSADEHAEGVARLAEAYPRGKFIIAHAGGGRAWRRGLEYVRRRPNVWVEVMDNAQPGELEGVLAAVGPARMTYGTDFGVHASPELRYEAGNHLLDRLCRLGLEDADIEKICSGNAVRLMNL
ncbi:MAG: amidohydrolase family protein [Phycisphaerae bacterium]